MVVVLTAPPAGVNETPVANPLPEASDTSKPAGAVTSRFTLNPVPDTVNVCSAEAVPEHATKASKVPETVMAGTSVVS